MEPENSVMLESCTEDTMLIQTVKSIVNQNERSELEGEEEFFLVTDVQNERQNQLGVSSKESTCTMSQVGERLIWSNLCRVCAGTNDHLIPIFDGEGAEHELCNKIHKYLPIHVSESDTLPLQLCYHCAATLLAWHELAEGCLSAERRLLEIQDSLQDKHQYFNPASEELEVSTQVMPTSDAVETLTEQQTDVKEACGETATTDSDRSGPSRKKSFAAYYSSHTTALCADSIIQTDLKTIPGTTDTAKDLNLTTDNDEEKTELKTCDNRSINLSDSSVGTEYSMTYGSDVSSNVSLYQDHLTKPIATTKTDVHSLKNQHTCRICQRVFKREFHLTRHVKVCTMKNCSNKTNLLKANNIKTEGSKELKGLPDTSRTDQKNDSEQGRNWRNYGTTKRKRLESYFCMYCDYTSKKKKLLEIHFIESHPEFARKKDKKSRCVDKETVMRARMEVDGKVYYHCNECGKNLYSPYTFSWHIRIHTGERPFTCHLCGKQFRVNQGLARHLRETHAGIKNFPCDLCGRMFSTKRNAEDHRRIHTGERPYVCNVCGKTFKQKASLFVHNRTHSDVFPFKCSYCDLSFRTRPPLMVHITKHTGEKPHACDICGRCFRIKYELKRHRLVHFDDKPWQCTECNLSFRQKRYLVNHKKLNHNTNSFVPVKIE